ncbi:hypothetical protein swp_3421 [Shewanella piezotolerans WP3]|uniref:Uncharacterized protein n=1 Tax=Shewanella piezotolerans (strain WP3 / JCM 13877) TaxID=225849 RepID=B8CRW2_SHEPW|nr:hypothetical protein swp_3421 [Shewanella piezotolerans WP3]
MMLIAKLDFIGAGVFRLISEVDILQCKLILY